MYKSKNWDEDKLDIHSSGYGSSKYGSTSSGNDKGYHSAKYGSEGKSASSDYHRNEKREDDEKKPDVFSNLIDEKPGKKYEKSNEEDVQFKAAKQVFSEHMMDAQKKERETRKDIKSIEDAIKMAIESEKNAIISDN